MLRRNITLSVFCYCLVAVVGVCTADPTQYYFTPLGPLGSNEPHPNAINNQGDVAGYVMTSAQTGQPFIWDGNWQEYAGFPSGTSFKDINDTGLVVGGTSVLPGDAQDAFVMGQNGVVELGGLVAKPNTAQASSYWWSDARGISNSGVVVGWSVAEYDYGIGGSPALSSRRAFRVDPLDLSGDGIADTWYQDIDGNGVNDLMSEIVGDWSGRSSADAISDSGLIAVSASSEVWLFDNGQSQLLGSGSIFGINDLGNIVGTSSQVATIWTTSGVETLTGGRVAFGINNLGDVVGVSSSDNAFIWQDGTLSDLNELVLDLPEGYHLLSANGINDLGQITGYAKLGDNYTAFLLTPVPEPSTLVLCVIFGFVVCVVAQLRRRNLSIVK